jgi:mono/diheme cytochrome c family protein
MKPFSLSKLFLSILVLIVLAGCSGPAAEVTQAEVEASPSAPASGGVSFAADVLPIFEDNCTRCHGDSRQNGGLRLDSYAALMAGGTDGAVVVAGEADGSLLVELVTSGEMPKNAASLGAEEIATIREWIDSGALDN